MRIYIDQSVKIENTNRATAIGLSNRIQFVVRIPAAVKKHLQREFRRRGKRRLFVFRTFIAGVVLTLQHAPLHGRSSVVIDLEYPGLEKVLYSMFFEMWSRISTDMPVIEFRRVGKRSKAHEVSHKTATGQRTADKTISYEEIRPLALK
ncbi:MAG: hypothetical protein HY372_02365 [Candidatus Andersenbacteria bacterium]|nr:hypothetical protein [Candidatus Andersenbacteria bacterium]